MESNSIATILVLSSSYIKRFLIAFRPMIKPTYSATEFVEYSAINVFVSLIILSLNFINAPAPALPGFPLAPPSD